MARVNGGNSAVKRKMAFSTLYSRPSYIAWPVRSFPRPFRPDIIVRASRRLRAAARHPSRPIRAARRAVNSGRHHPMCVEYRPAPARLVPMASRIVDKRRAAIMKIIAPVIDGGVTPRRRKA